MSGLSAFAEDTTLPDGWEDAIFEELGYEHAPPSWWNEEQALEMAIEKVKQIQDNGEYVNADWDGKYEYYTLALGTSDKSYNEDSRFSAYFTFYKDEPSFYLESESSNYILCDAYYGIHLMIEDNGSGGMNIYSTTGSKNQPYDYVNSSNKGYRIFEVEENEETGEKIVSYYHMTYGTYHCYSKSNLEPSIWESLGLKAPEVLEDSVNLSVSFTPSLSGEVDRIVEQNGVSAESDYFSMSITNNSSKNAQFVFAVVPSGNGLALSNAPIDSNTGFSMSNSTAKYYYTCKEWVWAPTIAYKNNLHSFTLTKYYQSCAWHIVGGGSTYTRSFNWNQLNLEKDVVYDAVVYAISTDSDVPISNFTNSNHEYYLDIFSGKEVYRSSFSLPNPVTYDSSNSEFGNTSNTGISGVINGLLNAEGYVDSETGETVIEDVYYSDVLDKYQEWNSEERIIRNDDGSFNFEGFNLDSVSNMLNMSKGVFGFFQNVVTFMPSWFWALILTGVTCLVAVGIIKALL